MGFVPTFMLSHRHDPSECPAAFAAWHGFDSPLRRQPTLASCAGGGHALWWTVEAPSTYAALAQLPDFVAARTDVTEVQEVPIP
jgi:hypothetical protein